jgi:hypothetical protein
MSEYSFCSLSQETEKNRLEYFENAFPLDGSEGAVRYE